jgi:alpha/beta superfamily hydrolase
VADIAPNPLTVLILLAFRTVDHVRNGASPDGSAFAEASSAGGCFPRFFNSSNPLRARTVPVKRTPIRSAGDSAPLRDIADRGLEMPEVIFTGPAGRIEGRYHPAPQKNAPLAIILHPHPQFGGTMNHQIIYQLYYSFVHRGFAAIRFNFRGVGRSQGSFDHGTGELSDAASALDWAQSINPEARSCWIAGFSFGAWIGMQLLMRRPEIEGFISIAPPANLYDFSFLAPCPSSGLIVHGDKDAVVPHRDVTGLVDKLKTQKGIVIEQKVIPGANHFFDGKIDVLMQSVSDYLDKRLQGNERRD